MLNRSVARQFSKTAVRLYSMPEEPLKPVAVQLWELRELKKQGIKKEELNDVTEKSDLYNNELYTPVPKVRTGMLKDLPFPLHYPKKDQMRKSLEESGLPGSFVNKPFEKDAMIGDYPRLLNQWSILKNPHSYWDKQGRRKYGEILHDFDNFTDVMGIGAEQSPAHGLKLLAQALGFIAVVCTAFYIWDPASHAIVGPREYPFDNLRVELGGDPNDPNDNIESTRRFSA